MAARPPAHARSAVLAVVPALLVGLVATWAALTDSWNLLGVTHAFGATYADLRQVTATAGCITSDPTWSMKSMTCDPFGRGYNYPSLWAHGFAILGIDESSTELVALVFIGFFVGAILLVSLLSTWSVQPSVPLLSVSAAALAPPTWLALERGNIDLLVFVTVTLTALASILHRGLLPPTLLAIASVLKIFPAGAALILLRDRKHHPRSLWVFIGLMAVGSAFVVKEVPLIGQRTPQPTGAAFGASLLFQIMWNRLGLPESSVIPRLLGVLAFACMFLFVVVLVTRLPKAEQSISQAINGISRDRIASTLVLVGGGSFIFAYLLGTNYDYRLMFMILLVAGLARSARHALSPTFLLMSAIIVQLWLGFPMPVPYWLQIFSDFIWFGLAPVVGFLILRLSSGSAPGDERLRAGRDMNVI